MKNTILLVFLIISSCTLGYKDKGMNYAKSLNSNEHKTISYEKNDMKYFVRNNKTSNTDTLSLDIFWNDLQKNIIKGQRKEVISKFNFPIRAIYPVIFKYAHNCDTVWYTKNEEKYCNFDITMDNIDKYYDFVFTDELKKVITETSTQDLLSKGYLNKKIPVLTYSFFPKDYDLKVNCPNDHNMKFNFIFKHDRWKITISGL